VIHPISHFVYFVVIMAGSSAEKISCSVHIDVSYSSGRHSHVCSHRFFQGGIGSLGVDFSSWARPRCCHIRGTFLIFYNHFFMKFL
jgi:hypothetical protein